MKKIKILHWVFTVLISGLLVMSASMYILKHDEVAPVFAKLGFPIWLMIPMAVAKFSAVTMLITKFNKTLTEWAYAGLFFNLLLAVGAHAAIGENIAAPAVAATLLLGSYFSWKKIQKG